MRVSLFKKDVLVILNFAPKIIFFWPDCVASQLPIKNIPKLVSGAKFKILRFRLF